MADWSELPKDLLQLISSRLESPLYLLRFRSVCSSWRSSSPLTLTPTPFTQPIIPLTNTFTHPILPPLINTFTLSHRTLLLITQPNPNPNPNHRPWLLKLSHHHHHPRAPTARLFHPLSRTPLKPPRFPLDLLRLNTLDLGREFFLLANTQPNNSLYMEKLVLLSFPNDRFALLTIHVSGKLTLFHSGGSAWTVIPDMPTPYDDVCIFRGRLYGVDNTGRTVTVELDDATVALGLAAGPVFGGDKKFLVECEGKLLLVDKYLYYEDFEEEVDVVGEIGWDRTVKFEVYRLDEDGKRWVEVGNLGESVLFLGDDCAFSASAEDLGVGRGNCIVFRDDGLGANWVENGMGVFSLDDGKISPLSNCPGFNQLFWPPPDWVRLH